MANLKVIDAEQLETDLTSVADSIRAKTGGEDALSFPSGFVSAVDTIESADSALAEVEYALSNGYTDYSYMFFNKASITKVPSELFIHSQSVTKFTRMFYKCYDLTDVPLFDTSNGTDFNEMFYYCADLTNIPNFDLSNGKSFYLMFWGTSITDFPTLNTINGENFSFMFQGIGSAVTIGGIDLSNATNISGMFENCNNLANITFNGCIKITGLSLSQSSKLTHDSLMSAINALYDWASEGSTSTYKLTLGSTNLAKLTDAEKAIATQKGWTLA